MKCILFVPLTLMFVIACGQQQPKKKLKPIETNIAMENKMKIEIWSDVMCPFCYIGKRKFETALAQFPHKDKVELVWKSFQLAPDLKTQPDKNSHEFLAEHKGISVNEAKGMNDYVTQMAKQTGLVYNLDKSVVANSFNAHRFTHFAKQNGKQNEAEELLFRSYFTDGKNIDDYSALIQMGKEIGLDTTALKTALENGTYADEVRADIYEAQQVGVRGVPFFLFDKKSAVSGAQDSKTFLETLEKAYNDWSKNNPQAALEVIEGKVCTYEGECK
ncbi:MAG: DsbA family oxidoreductase [Bacteroidota bacterium]